MRVVKTMDNERQWNIDTIRQIESELAQQVKYVTAVDGGEVLRCSSTELIQCIRCSADVRTWANVVHGEISDCWHWHNIWTRKASLRLSRKPMHEQTTAVIARMAAQ
jgi:hypothetical protein